MKKLLLLLLSVAAFQAKAQSGGVEVRLDSFKTNIPIQFRNLGEGAGKILTSDALGRASWQTPTTLWTLGGIGGTAIRNTNPGGLWSSNSTLVPFDTTNILPFVPVEGEGTRMMWVPSRSAFRCGSVSGNAWDANNVGLHSFAAGYNSWASGIGNVALGMGAISDGSSNTFAFGENSHASGNGNMAFGSFALADGSVRAIAFGENTHASGDNSTAIGTGTTANAYYSVALGYYNSPIATASATTWVNTDPLLYIGNGKNASTLSNAMVIQKNGVVNIGVNPTSSTSFKLKVGGNISATGIVQALAFVSTNLIGTDERPLCVNANGELVECSTLLSTAYYNVSALGFHPILSASTPSSAFVRVVEKALISFANNTKSADAYAFAPLELPNGAMIDKMSMNFKQNTGGTMTLTFYSVGKQTDAIGTVEGTITSVAGSGIQEKSISFTSKNLVIENNKYYYYLKLEAGANWQGTDMALRGVVFTYKYASRL